MCLAGLWIAMLLLYQNKNRAIYTNAQTHHHLLYVCGCACVPLCVYILYTFHCEYLCIYTDSLWSISFAWYARLHDWLVYVRLWKLEDVFSTFSHQMNTKFYIMLNSLLLQSNYNIIISKHSLDLLLKFSWVCMWVSGCIFLI